MSHEQFDRAREIFLKALEIPIAERDSWLADTAGDDPRLLEEVRSLLSFHEEESAEPGADNGTLEPGELYAGRYRVIRSLGRGGMGEVFEARDENLDVTVALKRLLHTGVAQRDLFRNEVRLARQITHSTVCRMYDLGEFEGELFLTMEFVDGEDLASLLRRVGRLPTERVAEIGRSLCVGLAAAHALGVVHRDLKPANILIDSRGRVRITDFGIAVLRDDPGAIRTSAGTPSYMAPEQLIPGGAVTEQSDIYSLGLVLQEMLTGQGVFHGDSPTEILDRRRKYAPRKASELVSGVDPALEQVILSCLKNNPADRPGSVLQLAGELPGGDALGVAVEAGVTPSPELVARSHRAGGGAMARRTRRWIVALVLLLGAVAIGNSELGYFPAAIDDTHPRVRTHRAAALLRELGAPEASRGTFHGYFLDPTSREEQQSLFFWYREDGPRRRTTFQRTILDPAEDLLLFDGPPSRDPGSNVVVFDEAENLVYLHIGVADSGAGGDGVAADRIFEHAGLDRREFIPLELRATEVAADSAWVWSTSDPANTNRNLHVELAKKDGRVVYFSTGVPEFETQSLVAERLARINLLDIIAAPLVALLFLIGIVMAFINFRHRRVDGVGTWRLVIFVAIAQFLGWLLLSGYLPHPGLSHQSLLFSRLIALVILNPLLLLIIYPAIEPGVRRFLPRALVAWSRALRGDFLNRDMGWSLLAGITVGCAWGLISVADKWIAREFGGVVTPGIDHAMRLQSAHSLVGTLSSILRQFGDAIGKSGITLFVFLLFRMRLKNELGAWIGFVLITGMLETLVSGSFLPVSWIVVGLPLALSSAWLLRNFGLAAYIVAGFAAGTLRFSPISLEGDVWWARGGYLSLIVLLSIGAAGAYLSSRPVRKTVSP